MSRILLVTPGEPERRQLMAALAPLGHQLEACTTVHEAASRQADIVVVHTDPTCTQGREAVERLRQGPVGPRILWAGPGVASGLGLVFAEEPDGVLPPPVTVSSAGAALSRLERQAHPLGTSPADLEAVDGPLEAYPPFRVLWLVHRQRATGRLEVFCDDVEWELFVSDGQLVDGRGLSGAAIALGQRADTDATLSALIGAAIGRGQRPDEVFEVVGQAVGEAAARTVGRSGGMVFFDPHAELPPGAVPLPVPLPLVLARGLREVRSVQRVREVLVPVGADALQAVHDEVGPKGLPPVALRLWRAADGKAQLDGLCGEDNEAWLAADLLLQLGLARLVVYRPPAPPPPPPEPEPEERPAGRPKRSRPAEVRSEVVDELVSERKRLMALDAPGILGITKSDELEARAIDARFRVMSARFHPDRYAKETEAARMVARDCFALVNEAYAVLRDEAVREEVRLRLAAREQGKVYSSDSDKRKARILYTQGEVAFRRRGYEEAVSLLERSADLHPEPWKTRFLLTRARYEAGLSQPEECAMELMKIDAPPGRAKAEVLYHLGEMLLLSDREQAGFKAFEQAVGEYPEHVDAKRRLRLRRMRQEGVEAVRQADREERARRADERDPERPLPSNSDEQAAKSGGLFGGLFKRK